MVPTISIYIALLIFSFIITSILIVPFIDLLYRLHLTHHHYLKPTIKEETGVFNVALIPSQKLKIGTPIGGGILIIFIVSLLFAVTLSIYSKLGLAIFPLYSLLEELNILFFTFISFSLLGLYDDILKIFNLNQNKFIIKPLRKTTLTILLSGLISLMLYLNLQIEIFYIPFIGTITLGWFFVPISTLIISFFSKAFDITDGMDGLAVGNLLISLIAFWAISLTVIDSILSVFIALWVGSLIAFLYFNVYPARIWLGNVGSLSFGATLAVIAILLGKTGVLFLIGFFFVLEAFSQLIQVVVVSITRKPAFPVTPIHYWLQSLGWPEPKIVMRSWLFTLITAVFGLWLSEI